MPDADDINDGYAIEVPGPERRPVAIEFLYFGADRDRGERGQGHGLLVLQERGQPERRRHLQRRCTRVGDILLLGTFTEGGASTTIRVFKWVGTGGDTNNVLQTGAGGTSATASRATTTTAATRSTTARSSRRGPTRARSSGTPANTIYAGGGDGGRRRPDARSTWKGCFSTFLAETRSSPEISAQLKDFLLGRFEACDSALVDDAEGRAPASDRSRPDGPSSIGTGIGDRQGLGRSERHRTGTNGSGTLTFFICGPIVQPERATPDGVARSA